MENIIEEIEEKVEKGEEAIKEIVEKVEEKLLGKKPKKISKKNAEKKAELESVGKESKILEEKKKSLFEKAAKLRKKIEQAETEDLKEQVKIKKKTDMLVPLEEYVKAGIYLGTRVVTPDMRPFIYRRRADGLAIFNTDLIDEKLKEGIEYLNKFNAEDIILICKRQAGWKAAEKFSELTGIRVFTKKYPAGILTNKALPNFFENELTIITDSWLDKNALNDTLQVHKKILMICDTNNFAKGASSIILGNNKSAKSIGLIFYLLTREYCKAKKISANIPELEWWTKDEEEKSEKRFGSIIAKPGAKFGV